MPCESADFFFLRLLIFFSNLSPNIGLNSQPWAQESHTLLTQPARHPESANFLRGIEVIYIEHSDLSKQQHSSRWAEHQVFKREYHQKRRTESAELLYPILKLVIQLRHQDCVDLADTRTHRTYRVEKKTCTAQTTDFWQKCKKQFNWKKESFF